MTNLLPFSSPCSLSHTDEPELVPFIVEQATKVIQEVPHSAAKRVEKRCICVNQKISVAYACAYNLLPHQISEAL
jgi:hypothetical protein